MLVVVEFVLVSEHAEPGNYMVSEHIGSGKIMSERERVLPIYHAIKTKVVISTNLQS